MSGVVIVGGGIAGLAAAYELHKAGRAVTVVEKDRLGGVIRTERHGDLLVEGGPDSFITVKPWAKELCEEMGLGDQLIPSRSKTVYVWSGGRLHEMPEGVFLTVPTKIGPFLRTGLISWPGKLRMGLDWILPRGPEVEDESVASFVRRRLGREALEKLAEPLMAGIFVASAEELSLRSTFPRFAQMEREHRSLIKALRRVPPASGGNTSPFVTLRGGMSGLVERLLSKMPGVRFVAGEAEAVEPASEGDLLGRWKVRVGGETLAADAVILAVPASVARKFRPELPVVKYVTTSTVSLAYRKFGTFEGAGFVIPRGEGRKILACTWTSNKFEGRAPEGTFLVRCFIKGEAADPVAAAREEVRSMLGAPEEPLFARAFTWRDRNPVYEVGHERKIREAEATLPPGLLLAGSGFHGVGIPDCVKDGRAVARRLVGVL